MSKTLQIANFAILLLHYLQPNVNVRSVAINATKYKMKGGEIVEKLKALIDTKFKTRAEFAKAIDVDPSVLSRMLASGNWKADRIESAVRVLKIPAKDIPVYFFANEVAKSGTKEREKV